jgi:hypothetical protein
MPERSYHLVGTNRMKRYQADLGEVMTDLGLHDNLEGYARGRAGREPAALGA